MVDFVNFQFGEFLLGLDYLYFKDVKNWLYPIEYKIIKDWHNNIKEYLLYDIDDFSRISILNYVKWLSIRQEGILAKEKLRLVLPESENEFLN